MTSDFAKLSESLRTDTQDNVLKREIKDNSAEIAKQLQEKGVYENATIGLRISVR